VVCTINILLIMLFRMQQGCTQIRGLKTISRTEEEGVGTKAGKNVFCFEERAVSSKGTPN